MESSTHVRLRMIPQLLSPTCDKKSLGCSQAGHRKGSAARESSCLLERQSRPRAEGSAESAPPRLRRRAGVLDPGAPPGTASGLEIPWGRPPPRTAAPRVPIAPGKGPGERLRPGLETGSTRLGPRAACGPLQAPGRGQAPGAGEGQDRLPTAASRPAGDKKAREESVRRLQPSGKPRRAPALPRARAAQSVATAWRRAAEGRLRGLRASRTWSRRSRDYRGVGGGDGGCSRGGSRHNRLLPLTGNLRRWSWARGRQGAAGTPWPAGARGGIGSRRGRTGATPRRVRARGVASTRQARLGGVQSGGTFCSSWRSPAKVRASPPAPSLGPERPAAPAEAGPPAPAPQLAPPEARGRSCCPNFQI
ncbi:uncharacterized protein LOC118147999 [Callithrix jacchus]|uniref:collagen alpha-1(I) chain-like n=1 Tax=Callithrix jacchus TaxID=9483 RepID=UPI00159E1704|nr:collagen alpha-1(I) chain-like [Callithrix jacchus]